MIYLQVNSDGPQDDSDKSLAKELITFSIWQARRAAIEVVKADAKLQAMEAANMAAESVYNREENRLDWGPILPHDSYDLERAKKALKDAELNSQHHDTMLKFLTNRLFEKYDTI